MSALSGRLAVVTGGSRGIGLATAEMLAGAGATVVRVARTLTHGPHGKFHDIRCDLADVPSLVEATTRILGEWGTPHIVINNAGAFVYKPFEATEPAELDQQLALHIRAPFVVAQSFLPAMRAAGGGLLINVGSVSDHAGYPDNSAYAASKFGLRGLHETLVMEYRGTGVRMSLVSPGPTDTSVWDPVNPDERAELPSRADMLRPADVAEAILFVATRPAHVHIDWLRLGPA